MINARQNCIKIYVIQVKKEKRAQYHVYIYIYMRLSSSAVGLHVKPQQLNSIIL